MSEKNGQCGSVPAHIEIARYRGNNLQIGGVPQLYELLIAIDGERSVEDIAGLVGCSSQHVIAWANELQKALIVDW